jgi:hypothetical protein
MTFDIVNPLELSNWDDLVLATGKASFFHSSAWARVLYESYGYKPVYFCSFENGNLSTLMAFMEVESWLTGKRGVSLPFSDHCAFLGADQKSLPEMIGQVFDYGKRAGWRYMEWRDTEALFQGNTTFSHYVLHMLDLDRDLAAISAAFRESTRRNIKKAQNQGVKVSVLQSPNAMKEFYRLHCATRKGHGFPPQPYKFFDKIAEHTVSAGKGIVVMATFQEIPVAGAVFFQFGDKALFKFGASDKRYHYLRPNNLVMWEAIRWHKDRSFRSLDFGRTSPEEKGLLQFKAGWGTETEELFYCKYDLRKSAFVRRPEKWGLASRFAAKLPLPVFNWVGSLLYRHVG